jgi:hypothetical protein
MTPQFLKLTLFITCNESKNGQLKWRNVFQHKNHIKFCNERALTSGLDSSGNQDIMNWFPQNFLTTNATNHALLAANSALETLKTVANWHALS